MFSKIDGLNSPFHSVCLYIYIYIYIIFNDTKWVYLIYIHSIRFIDSCWQTVNKSVLLFECLSVVNIAT